MKEVKEKKQKVKRKLSSRAKKVIVLGCFCVLLLVTGGVNIYLNNMATEEANANASIQSSANFFTNYRTDRQETRNQEILYLDAIIASDATSAEAKANAEAERLGLVTKMETIMTIENLIKAKGFEDCIVTNVNPNVKIVVKCANATLTSAEVAQIVSVVKDQTNAGIDNIQITPVE